MTEIFSHFRAFDEVPAATLIAYEIAIGVCLNSSGPIALPGLAMQLATIEDERQRRLQSEHKCFTVGDLARWYLASRTKALAAV